MLKEDINNLPLTELMDILVRDTKKLLELMNQRDANGITIKETRIDLQMIQSEIAERKSNSLHVA